jgi:hypothetical protein
MIKVVTMPEPDDVPRLAEISRTLSDFRSEFREAISGMVRRDVYMAEMRTFDVRLENLALELKRIENDANTEIRRVDTDIEKDRSERRTLRAQVIGAGLTAAVTFIFLIIKAWSA